MMDGSMNDGMCPVMHGGNTGTDNSVTKWWPKTLNLGILHQHGARTNPMDPDYNHREAVKGLDYEAVKEVAGFISPVPGGVGPMTITMLLKNTVESAARTAESAGA